ncbi:MAG: iron ABC transporter permease, partial [Gemmatimonadetes bacterium]|nr:iron ABC transporter permease [Gemmatimonadota bacterium]
MALLRSERGHRGPPPKRFFRHAPLPSGGAASRRRGGRPESGRSSGGGCGGPTLSRRGGPLPDRGACAGSICCYQPERAASHRRSARASRRTGPGHGGTDPAEPRRPAPRFPGECYVKPRSIAPGWLAFPVVGVLLWAILYPNLFVLRDSVWAGGTASLEGYRTFLSSRAELEALWGSLWISAGSVVASAAIGIPLAFVFSYFDFPGRAFFGAVAAVPVLLPPLVGVIAFHFLYGESGILTRALELLFGLDQPPWRLVGGWAVLFVHAYTMYVYFYLFTSAGLARLDPAAQEAAESLGAGRWRTLFRVTLPMLAPSIGAASVLVFMTSMASFSAPYVFGGGFRVLTTQIFASKVNGELTMAAVEAVALACASLLFLVLLRRLERGREFAAVGKGVGAVRRAVTSRFAKVGAPLVGVGAVLFLLLPHLTLVLVSFVPEGSWTTQILPTRYSLENYRSLFSSSDLWIPVTNSVRMAALATAGNLVFCFLLAYLLVRGRVRGKGALTFLMMLPWALPGTVIAMALATAFSVNQPWFGRFVLVGTFWILPFAYFVRNVPLVAQAAMASFRQYDVVMEEAAESLGASWWTTVRRVAIPLVLPGLAAGGLLAFVAALGEFVSSILLYTYRSRPISVEIL